MPAISAFRKQRKFKITFNYLASLRLAWSVEDSTSKTNKTTAKPPQSLLGYIRERRVLAATIPRMDFKFLLLLLFLYFLFFFFHFFLPLLLSSSSLVSLIFFYLLSLPPHPTIHWIIVCGFPASELLDVLIQGCRSSSRESSPRILYSRKHCDGDLWEQPFLILLGSQVPKQTLYPYSPAWALAISPAKSSVSFHYHILSLRLSQNITSWISLQLLGHQDLTQISRLPQSNRPSGVLLVLSGSLFLHL